MGAVLKYCTISMMVLLILLELTTARPYGKYSGISDKLTLQTKLSTKNIHAYYLLQ